MGYKPPPKSEQVFRLVQKIPKGKITTYKEIGSKLGLNPREVGRILSKNEDLRRIKCYKVVGTNREIGGYRLGETEKIRKLRREGIKIKKGKIVNFKEKVIKFF